MFDEGQVHTRKSTARNQNGAARKRALAVRDTLRGTAKDSCFCSRWREERFSGKCLDDVYKSRQNVSRQRISEDLSIHAGALQKAGKQGRNLLEGEKVGPAHIGDATGLLDKAVVSVEVAAA